MLGGSSLIRFRNGWAHGEPGVDPSSANNNVKMKVNLFLLPGFKFSVLSGDESGTWQAPSAQFLKLNCDGAYHGENGRAGVGCIVRDGDGAVESVMAEPLGVVPAAVDVEGWAILILRFAKAAGWCWYIFETDSAETFSLIHHLGGSSSLETGENLDQGVLDSPS